MPCLPSCAVGKWGPRCAMALRLESANGPRPHPCSGSQMNDATRSAAREPCHKRKRPNLQRNCYLQVTVLAQTKTRSPLSIHCFPFPPPSRHSILTYMRILSQVPIQLISVEISNGQGTDNGHLHLFWAYLCRTYILRCYLHAWWRNGMEESRTVRSIRPYPTYHVGKCHETRNIYTTPDYLAHTPPCMDGQWTLDGRRWAKKTTRRQ
ncbi:hypothetical protein B0T24DRAFT_56566 [Lasiosphaeria ovina]|uniref:Uncharacterized protein n=1 Tax=Lasiosphaeria ovina TaxID=92902 RepID=A0AAE0TY11_9PEZI|nr:hypothetical protein B0T24DRAFT_56566 [Lasiosphaeria ovina]